MAGDDVMHGVRSRAQDCPGQWVSAVPGDASEFSALGRALDAREGEWAGTADGFYEARPGARTADGRLTWEVRYVPFASRTDFVAAVAERLDRRPDDDWKRRLVEWLTHCEDLNLDTEPFHYFLDQRATLDEDVRLFLSPLDCADEVRLRMDRIWPASRAPVDDAVLLAALHECVDEMVRNADATGEHELATAIRSVSEFQVVDAIERRHDVEGLDAHVSSAVFDLVHDAAYRGNDNLVANFWGVAHDWFEFGSGYAVYVTAPLLNVAGIELDAFMALHDHGGEFMVTSERATVARF